MIHIFLLSARTLTTYTAGPLKSFLVHFSSSHIRTRDDWDESANAATESCNDFLPRGASESGVFEVRDVLDVVGVAPHQVVGDVETAGTAGLGILIRGLLGN